MEMSGQLHPSAALQPPVPIAKKAGWAPEQVWTTQKSENSCTHRDSNVARRYTENAISLVVVKVENKIKFNLNTV
jgi:hypothetical protein